jgi:hypothetical protein
LALIENAIIITVVARIDLTGIGDAIAVAVGTAIDLALI